MCYTDFHLQCITLIVTKHTNRHLTLLHMPLSQDEHLSYKQMRRQIFKNTINVKCLFTSLHQITHTVLRTSGYLVHSLMSCPSTDFH